MVCLTCPSSTCIQWILHMFHSVYSKSCEDFGISGVSLPWPVLLPGRDWKLVERRPTCGAAHSSTAGSSWIILEPLLSKDSSRSVPICPNYSQIKSNMNLLHFLQKTIVCGVFAAGKRLHRPASRKCTSKNHLPVSWACFGKPMVIQSDLNFEVYCHQNIPRLSFHDMHD